MYMLYIPTSADAKQYLTSSWRPDTAQKFRVINNEVSLVFTSQRGKWIALDPRRQYLEAQRKLKIIANLTGVKEIIHTWQRILVVGKNKSSYWLFTGIQSK